MSARWSMRNTVSTRLSGSSSYTMRYEPSVWRFRVASHATRAMLAVLFPHGDRSPETRVRLDHRCPVHPKVGYEAVMARFVATQAPRLAETLADGCPCPVCGSIKHPAPARFAEGEQVDHEEVDAARAMWSKEQAAVAGAVQEVAQLVESLGEAEAKATALEQKASSCRTTLAVAEADAARSVRRCRLRRRRVRTSIRRRSACGLPLGQAWSRNWVRWTACSPA